MAASARLPSSVFILVDVSTAVLIVAVLHAPALAVSAFVLEAVGSPLGCWLLGVGCAVWIAVFGISKLHILVLELFLNELFRIVELRELDLLLLDDERWQLPPPFLVVPVCLLLYLAQPFICHYVSNNLV